MLGNDVQDNSGALADRAYRYIEEQIVTMNLRPGDTVPDKAIAETLGISRTPVREAILRLRNERLVESQARRGLFVQAIDLADYRDILETRRALDNLITRTACQRAEPEHLADLRICAAEMRAAGASRDVEAFMRADRRFDQIVAEAARLVAATAAVMPLHSHCRRFWYAHKRSGDLAASATYHIEIMEALALQDGDRAVAGNNTLIDYLVSFLRNILGD